QGASFKFACHAEAGEGGCLKSVRRKNLNSDDHFDRSFAPYRMKAKQRNQRKEQPMNPLTQFKRILILPILIALMLVALVAPASATLPPGNTVEQWNKIAEDTVVGSGAFQSEGLIYMSYTSAAVYDAAVAIDGGFEPYGPAITAPPGASVDCAVVEAAYRTLHYYFSLFPTLVANLDAYYAEARLTFGGCTADGGGGTLVGQTAATN